VLPPPEAARVASRQAWVEAQEAAVQVLG
jgi:hypothetical protein